jgi:hypothetical protein
MTNVHAGAVRAVSSTDAQPSGDRRRWWSIVAVLLVAGIFAQAVFAGLMLSGVDWARAAHSASAVALIASTLAAGLVAVSKLRRVPQGARFGWTLLALAVLLCVQTAVGKSVAEGANLMWVHIPLGVALVGFAGQAVAVARRVGV